MMIDDFTDRPNMAAAQRMIGHVTGQARRREVLAQTRLMLQQTGIRAANVSIRGELNNESERRIRRELEGVWGARHVNLTINSPGGLSRIARAISTDLGDLAKCNVHISANVVGQCNSAAIEPFLQASLRTCSPNASFLLHRMSLDYDAAARLTAPMLHTVANMMNEDDQMELAMLKRRGVWLPANWQARYVKGDDLKLSARDAHGIGLISWVTNELTPA